MSNGANSGSSSSDPNKERRIRLRNRDIQIIAEALRIHDMLPENPPQNLGGCQKLIEKIYDIKKLKYSWLEQSDLRRRFSVLAADEGWYARRSR